MSIREYLLVILGAVLADNIVFEGFLGLPAVLGTGKNSKKALLTGLWVAAVMLVSQAAFWPVQRLLIAKSVDYLSDFAALAVILVIVYAVKLILGAKANDGFVLVALNSAVLGLCLGSVEKGASFGDTLIYAFGAALGFLFAMLLFSGIASRIDERKMPKIFRGAPALLLAAFIIAMALTAYK